MRDEWVVRAGWAAVVGGVLGLVVAPLHALAYFATGEPGGLLAWREVGHAALRPLLEWGNEDLVYTSYGKVALFVIAGFTAGLFAVRARRAAYARGAERWGLRIAVVGYPLLLVGVTVEYWTSNLDSGFLVSLAGMLLTLIGSTLLGIGRLRAGQGPRTAAWLLALSVPLVFGSTAVIGHLTAGLAALDVAWILIGLQLARPAAVEVDVPAATSAR